MIINLLEKYEKKREKESDADWQEVSQPHVKVVRVACSGEGTVVVMPIEQNCVLHPSLKT